MVRWLGLAAYLVLAASALAGEAPHPVDLEVHADCSVILDGRFIRYFHRLDVNLRELARSDPKPVVHIRATANVMPEVMAKVLTAVTAAGLKTAGAAAR